jgi:restriction system protein
MSYQITVKHDGLHKYRVIRAKEAWEAEAKAEAQRRAWEEQWQRKQELELQKEGKERERSEAQERKEARQAEADLITVKAQASRRSLEEILSHTLRVDDTVDWSRMLESHPFAEPRPAKPHPPPKPCKPERRIPTRPATQLGFLRRIFEAAFPNFERDRLAREEQEYTARLREAERSYEEARARYNEQVPRYNEEVRLNHEKWQAEIAQWEGRREAFLAEQRERNEKVREFNRRWLAKYPDAVSEYCELVLQNSEYPDFFPGNFDLMFNPTNGILNSSTQ